MQRRGSPSSWTPTSTRKMNPPATAWRWAKKKRCQSPETRDQSPESRDQSQETRGREEVISHRSLVIGEEEEDNGVRSCLPVSFFRGRAWRPAAPTWKMGRRISLRKRRGVDRRNCLTPLYGSAGRSPDFRETVLPETVSVCLI
jgi:hypothetical protein